MKSYVAPLYLLVFLPAVVFLYNIVPKKLRPVVASGKLPVLLEYQRQIDFVFAYFHIFNPSFWVVAVKPSGRT